MSGAPRWSGCGRFVASLLTCLPLASENVEGWAVRALTPVAQPVTTTFTSVRFALLTTPVLLPAPRSVQFAIVDEALEGMIAIVEEVRASGVPTGLISILAVVAAVGAQVRRQRERARLMAWLTRGDNRELTVLVATSGDTGGAVASAFGG